MMIAYLIIISSYLIKIYHFWRSCCVIVFSFTSTIVLKVCTILILSRLIIIGHGFMALLIISFVDWLYISIPLRTHLFCCA